MPVSTGEHQIHSPSNTACLTGQPSKPNPAPAGPISGKDRQAQTTTTHQQGRPRLWRPLTLAATLAHCSAVGPTYEGGHFQPAALQDTPTAFHTGRDNKTGPTNPAVSTRILKDNSSYMTSFIHSNSNLKRTRQQTLQDSP